MLVKQYKCPADQISPILQGRSKHLLIPPDTCRQGLSVLHRQRENEWKRERERGGVRERNEKRGEEGVSDKTVREERT